MKTLAVTLIMVMIITGAVTGVCSAVSPSSIPNSTPTSRPTPNSSPDHSSTPASLQVQTPTGSPSQIVIDEPNPTLSSVSSELQSLSASPASESWSVTKIDEASASTIIRLDTNYYFNPRKAEDIFISVKFELNAHTEAPALDVNDVLLMVDEAEFRPIGHKPSSYGVVGSFSGNITRQGYSFNIVYVANSNNVTSTTNANFTGIPTLTFVYVLSAEYLDGGHSLRLKIAGSTEGVTFTVETPEMLQGQPAISPTGNSMTVSRLNKIYFFDNHTGAPSWFYAGTFQSSLKRAVFSSDGSEILVVSSPTVLMFNKSSNQPMWTVTFNQSSGVSAYAISNDGKLVAVAANNNQTWGYYVYVMNANDGSLVGRLGDKKMVSNAVAKGAIFSIKDLEFSSDGRYLIVAGFDTLYLFDCPTSSEIWRNEPLSPQTRDFKSVTFSADGRYISALYSDYVNIGNVKYTVQTYQRSSNASLWDYNGTALSQVNTNEFWTVLSSDGSSLLVAVEDNASQLFNGQTGTLMWTKTMKNFQSQITSVSMSIDGNVVTVACNDGVLRLLNKAGNIINSQVGLGSEAAISEDGKFIIVSSRTLTQFLSGTTLATIWSYMPSLPPLIPEFPSPIILTVLLLVAISVVTYFKTKPKTNKRHT